MVRENDKVSAAVPYQGEAQRIAIRRPRLDRDGLYLFGRRHDSQSLTLTAAELGALFAGKSVAVDVLGEYLLYVRVKSDDS